MERFKRLCWSILVGLSLTAPLPAKGDPPRASAYLGSCHYYRALSDELGCDNDGYLRAFGERYCREFENADRRFTPEGRKILAGIRLCLQLELETQRSRLDCRSVKAIAVATHSDCYARHEFCRMEIWEKAIALQIVMPALGDPELREAIGHIAISCGASFSE